MPTTTQQAAERYPKQAEAPAGQRPILIKGHCTSCAHYHNCPRMQGKSVCYNTKEVWIERSER